MKKELYNINLLKVFCIIGIIILHYFNYGGFFDNDVSYINNIFIHFFESLSIVCCNVFVIITGYLYINKDSIKLRKIIDIIVLLITYGIIIFLISIIFKINSVNFGTILLFFKSITSRWFILNYIILYLLIPYLNRTIQKLDKREFLLLIVILGFFFSLWPTFYDNVTLKDNGYGIINFVLLYYIGGYIKLYIKKYNSIKVILIYIFSLIITFIGSFYSGRLWAYSSIFCIINATSLFMIFNKINVKDYKLISDVSKCSLAIYIIHENQLIVRYLFRNIYKTSNFYMNNYMVLHMFATVISILVVCFFIEKIRTYIMDVTINKILNKSKLFNKELNLQKKQVFGF